MAVLLFVLFVSAAGCGSRKENAAESISEQVSEETLNLIDESSMLSEENSVSPEENSIPPEENSVSSEESIVPSEENNVPSEENSASSEESSASSQESSVSSEESDPVGLLTAPMDPDSPEDGLAFVTEDGEYSSKEQVAAYIHEFGHLPGNYISKKKAEELGWVASKGNLWDVAPGKSIGGSRFGNYEGILPDKKGRKYYECDIDFDGEFRGAKRIIYSNDGLIYYTDDHYKTFEKLY